MSAKLREDFLGESSQTLRYSEEFWHEEAPIEVNEFRSHHEEIEKKYKLVFNGDSQSVRLESEPLQNAIQECIEQSRHILTIGDNWDDEGSQGYSQSTWVRATNLVKDLSINYWEKTRSWIDPPRIMPGPEGSIDIHWKILSRELLINVPADIEAPAGYFGSGGSKESIKGKLDTSLFNYWILSWLCR